jgi:hypothetical protein
VYRETNDYSSGSKLQKVLGQPDVQRQKPHPRQEVSDQPEVLNVKKSLIKIAQNMLNFGRRIKIF